jgi:hypothetical protein
MPPEISCYLVTCVLCCDRNQPWMVEKERSVHSSYRPSIFLDLTLFRLLLFYCHSLMSVSYSIQIIIILLSFINVRIVMWTSCTVDKSTNSGVGLLRFKSQLSHETLCNFIFPNISFLDSKTAKIIVPTSQAVES